MTVYV